jgi:hypothetical protein
METLNRREVIKGTAAAGLVGVLASGGMLGAQEKGGEAGLRVIEAQDKILLYWWDWVYYGAHMHVDLYYYPGEIKFCYEGTLDYAGITKIAEGELCVVKNDDGSFTVTGGCVIKIAGQKVASLDGKVTSRVNWGEGKWYLQSYRFAVCGTNTFELKCDTWEKNISEGKGKDSNPGVFLLKNGVAKDADEKLRAVVSIFEPRLGEVHPSTPPARHMR